MKKEVENTIEQTLRIPDDGLVERTKVASETLFSDAFGWSRNGDYFIIGEIGQDEKKYLCIWSSESLERIKCVAKFNAKFFHDDTWLRGFEWYDNRLFLDVAYHIGGYIFSLDIGGWKNNSFKEIDLELEPDKLKKLPIDGWRPFWSEQDNTLYYAPNDVSLSRYVKGRTELVLQHTSPTRYYVIDGYVWYNSQAREILRYNLKTKKEQKIILSDALKNNNLVEKLEGYGVVSVDKFENLILGKNDLSIYYNPKLSILRPLFSEKTLDPHETLRTERMSPSGNQVVLSVRRQIFNEQATYSIYILKLSKLLSHASQN